MEWKKHAKTIRKTNWIEWTMKGAFYTLDSNEIKNEIQRFKLTFVQVKRIWNKVKLINLITSIGRILF